MNTRLFATRLLVLVIGCAAHGFVYAAESTDEIAALRAQWAKLDNPGRIQGLARRHLALRPVEARQYDRLDNLPQRPPDLVPVEEKDPIGMMIARPEILNDSVTGSLGPARR